MGEGNWVHEATVCQVCFDTRAGCVFCLCQGTHFCVLNLLEKDGSESDLDRRIYMLPGVPPGNSTYGILIWQTHRGAIDFSSLPSG
jgi:hypothetical protein